MNPRRLIHLTNKYGETSPRESYRKAVARRSWIALYAKGVEPRYLVAPYPRNAIHIGDKRCLPFLKDMLMLGLSNAIDDDILILTNNDLWLHPNLIEVVRFQVAVYGPCCSQRREFIRCPIPEGRSPLELTQMSDSHPGRDLCAFTAKWLRQHWDDIGDFIVGSSEWDWALASMIRREYGINSTAKNLNDHIFPAEIPLGYVCHQFHHPAWVTTAKDGEAPAQVRNRMLFRKWASEHLPEMRFYDNGAVVV